MCAVFVHTHTHTHTHIYIYIYIHIIQLFFFLIYVYILIYLFITQIFDCEAKFHVLTESRPPNCSSKFIEPHIMDSGKHGLLVTLITKFGEGGGFKKMLTYVDQHPTDLAALSSILIGFGRSSALLSREIFSTFILPVYEIGIKYLNNLEGEKLKNDTKVFAKVVLQTSGLPLIINGLRGVRLQLNKGGSNMEEMDQFFLKMLLKVMELSDDVV